MNAASPERRGHDGAAAGRRAGAGALLVAFLIDAVVAVVVVFVVALFGFGSGPAGLDTGGSAGPLAWLQSVVLWGPPLLLLSVAVAVGLTGGSLGHRAVGVRVVRRTTGAAPGVPRALLRTAVIAAPSTAVLSVVFGGWFVLVALAGALALAVIGIQKSRGGQGYPDDWAGTRTVSIYPPVGSIVDRGPDDERGPADPS